MSNKTLISAPFYRRGECSSEKYSNVPKVAQLERSKAVQQTLGYVTPKPVLNPCTAEEHAGSSTLWGTFIL